MKTEKASTRMTHHLEKKINEFDKFIIILSEKLGVTDKEKSTHILITILHTLRETISVEESIKLITDVPPFLKEIYIKNWNPKKKSFKVTNLNDFLNKVQQNLKKNYPTNLVNMEEACRIVFRSLEDFVSKSEIDHISSILPESIRSLFDHEIILDY